MLLQTFNSGGSRGFKVSMETPFEELISILSDPDSLIEQSDRKAIITAAFVEKTAMCGSDDLFFGLQRKLGWHFCQAETETPFQKSWIRHCSMLDIVKRY